MSKRELIKEERIKRINRSKFNLLLVATILIVNVLVISFTFLSNAQANNNLNPEIYYSSIQINKNDTLWDIAIEYNNDNTKSTKEYVSEIMEINKLSNDMIYEGQYIIVTCYR